MGIPGSSVIRFPDRDNVREDAGLWVARIDRGLTAEEIGELDRWLAESPAHVEALLALAQLWEQTGVASELAEIFPLQRYCPSPSRFPRGLMAAGAAAALVCAVVVGTVWIVRPDGTEVADAAVESIREYATVIGAQSTVHLPDASTVTLNTNSEIEVRYSTAGRTILLKRGEAYFDVVHDSARPFKVHAGPRTLQAIGTAFDVRLGLRNDIKLMVTDGVVGVLSVLSASSSTADSGSADIEMTVEAGTLAIIDSGPIALHDLGVAALQTQLSWQRGMLAFDDERLETVLAEVGRYTAVELILDDAIRDVKVGGYFRAGDVDGLLLALSENFGIRSTRNSADQILLTPQ
jgi:transmembrane sensor